MWETRVPALGLEDPLKKGMATHSGLLAWRIPHGQRSWRATVHRVSKTWTRLSWPWATADEPVLQSRGLQPWVLEPPSLSSPARGGPQVGCTWRGAAHRSQRKPARQPGPAGTGRRNIATRHKSPSWGAGGGLWTGQCVHKGVLDGEFLTISSNRLAVGGQFPMVTKTPVVKTLEQNNVVIRQDFVYCIPAMSLYGLPW